MLSMAMFPERIRTYEIKGKVIMALDADYLHLMRYVFSSRSRTWSVRRMMTLLDLMETVIVFVSVSAIF